MPSPPIQNQIVTSSEDSAENIEVNIIIDKWKFCNSYNEQLLMNE